MTATPFKSIVIGLASCLLVSVAYGKCYPGLDCTEDLPNANQPAPSTNTTTPQPTPASSSSAEPEMVLIKGGCFNMGSPESEPERQSNETQHQVCVDDFYLGKYEVTQAQWQAIMGSNPLEFQGDNMPIEQVSYLDIQQFIARLNQQTNKTYRLPTEAQWEYAARAGTSTPFYTGDCIHTQQANYDGNSDYNNCGAKTGVYKKSTVAVGSYPANAWGLYDMAGNVWEWTCSAYDENYGGSEKQCFSNNDAKTYRVLRGGSWNVKEYGLRSAGRSYDTSDTRNSYGVGFRLARM